MSSVQWGFLPARDAELVAWLQNFDGVVSGNPVGYGVAPGEVTQLDALVAAFVSAYGAAVNAATRSSVTVAAKDVARAEVVSFVRVLAGKIRANPSVTPAMLLAAGLRVRQEVPSPIPAPTTVPLLSLVGSLGNVVSFTFADEETPNARYKPISSIGLLVVGGAGGSLPVDPDAAPVIGLFGRSPVRLEFAGRGGQEFVIWGRWVTRRGLFGPWSSALRGVVQL